MIKTRIYERYTNNSVMDDTADFINMDAPIPLSFLSGPLKRRLAEHLDVGTEGTWEELAELLEIPPSKINWIKNTPNYESFTLRVITECCGRKTVADLAAALRAIGNLAALRVLSENYQRIRAEHEQSERNLFLSVSRATEQPNPYVERYSCQRGVPKVPYGRSDFMPIRPDGEHGMSNIQPTTPDDQYGKSNILPPGADDQHGMSKIQPTTPNDRYGRSDILPPRADDQRGVSNLGSHNGRNRSQPSTPGSQQQDDSFSLQSLSLSLESEFPSASGSDNRCRRRLQIYLTYADDAVPYLPEIRKCLSERNYLVIDDTKESQNLSSGDKIQYLEHCFKQVNIILVLLTPMYKEDVEFTGQQQTNGINATQLIHKMMLAEHAANGYVFERFIPLLLPNAQSSVVPWWLRDTIVYKWPHQLTDILQRLERCFARILLMSS